MKLTALVVVILALGIVVGFAFAGGASEGPASAAPPIQQREDQITIFADGGFGIVSGATEYEALQNNGTVVALDPGDYPPSASFRFEGAWQAISGVTTCLRLFDQTAGAPVIGAETCYSNSSTTTDEDVRVRSAAVSLPPSEHEYIVQAKCVVGALSCRGHEAFAARIIVEWTEATITDDDDDDD